MVRLRSDYFVLATFVLTITVVLNAFFQKKQFYPTVVYLTKSSSGMAVLYLQAFVVALLIGKVVNKIFFGQLRPVELEVTTLNVSN
jgi:E3 ubiquitin-protein ligase synoviolin